MKARHEEFDGEVMPTIEFTIQLPDGTRWYRYEDEVRSADGADAWRLPWHVFKNL